MNTKELLSRPYKNTDNAFLDAQNVANETKQMFHIIYTHGMGYEVVKNDFIIGRLYYHNPQGKKMFFDFITTVTPDK